MDAKQKTSGTGRIILALDQATHTGWAVYENGIITAHGVKVFGKTHYNGELLKWLDAMYKQYGFTEIVAEDIYYQVKTEAAFTILAELRGSLKAWADEVGMQSPVFVEPKMVKKWVGAWEYSNKYTDYERYKRNKEAMKQAVKWRGYQLSENSHADDEADAIGIMLYYVQRLERLPLQTPRDLQQTA